MRLRLTKDYDVSHFSGGTRRRVPRDLSTKHCLTIPRRASGLTVILQNTPVMRGDYASKPNPPATGPRNTIMEPFPGNTKRSVLTAEFPLGRLSRRHRGSPRQTRRRANIQEVLMQRTLRRNGWSILRIQSENFGTESRRLAYLPSTGRRNMLIMDDTRRGVEQPGSSRGS